MALGGNDDPLKLRHMLTKAAELASSHALHSVVVGLAGREGDLMIPELLDFFESELRMDDAVFRMTRERAVLLLADVGRQQAEEIVRRLTEEYQERFVTARAPEIQVGYFEVTPAMRAVTVKEVLPAVFLVPEQTH